MLEAANCSSKSQQPYLAMSFWAPATLSMSRLMSRCDIRTKPIPSCHVASVAMDKTPVSSRKQSSSACPIAQPESASQRGELSMRGSLKPSEIRDARSDTQVEDGGKVFMSGRVPQ